MKREFKSIAAGLVFSVFIISVMIIASCQPPEPGPEPAADPTESPTAVPAEIPTGKPTDVPTAAPTEAPTLDPTAEPTAAPTTPPTTPPTVPPTAPPTPDTTGPTGSVKINNGAAYSLSLSVSLQISAYDPSGVTEMQISNNASWTTFAYSESLPWTLDTGNDGTRIVYMRFKDSLGNWGPIYSDSIDLDMYVKLQVKFDRIYVIDDGDLVGEGELYWSFGGGITGGKDVTSYGGALSRNDPLLVTSGTYYQMIGWDWNFEILSAESSYFEVKCEMGENDAPLSDDYLGIYMEWYDLNNGWGINTLEDWIGVLSGSGASVRIYYNIKRID